jgi:hypothetical protein
VQSQVDQHVKAARKYENWDVRAMLTGCLRRLMCSVAVLIAERSQSAVFVLGHTAPPGSGHGLFPASHRQTKIRWFDHSEASGSGGGADRRPTSSFLAWALPAAADPERASAHAEQARRWSERIWGVDRMSGGSQGSGRPLFPTWVIL